MALGPDSIHLRLLREHKCDIDDVLTYICNLLLYSAAVPEGWRLANVTSLGFFWDSGIIWVPLFPGGGGLGGGVAIFQTRVTKMVGKLVPPVH